MTTAPPTTRAISVRDGDLRYDIVVPTDLPVGEAIARIGVALPNAVRIVDERAGTTVDPNAAVQTLRDGDAISLVTVAAKPRRAARVDRGTRTPDTGTPAAWWMLGAAAVAAAVLFAAVPETLPLEWRWWVLLVLTIAGVAAAIVALRRPRATTATGPAVLAPTALLAATAVAFTPPSTYGIPLSLVAVTATVTGFLAFCAVIARGAVTRVQLGTLAVVIAVVGLAHAVIVVMDVPESSAAAILLGLVPLALRALPAFLMDVPTGLFIDVESHQQTRWTVRQQLPAEIPTVDRSRVADLIARSRARMLTGTASAVAVAVLFLVPAMADIDAVGPVERIGRTVLAVCLVTGLALASRHHSSRTLRVIVGGGAVATGLIATVIARPLISDALLPVFAVAALVIALLVTVGLVPVARGSRSLWWSRFGDIIETLCVVFALPAALVAAGTIDAIRGWMN